MSPKNTKSLSRSLLNQWPGLLVCMLSLGFSISTLPRDLVWGDSPELAASAWVLGIPHPTGYPLYMLLTRLFQALPIGTVLFRAHLFSAVCSGLAAWVLYIFLHNTLSSVFENRKSLTVLPAFAASLAWTFTHVVWSQSRIAEVYALFLLQFVLALWLFFRAMQNPQKTLYPLAFLIGTMLVHHRLSVFLIIFIALFLLLRMVPRTSKWFGTESGMTPQPVSIVKTILFLAIPILFLAYFPIRAAFDPAINWYDPDSPVRLYQLISGQLYSGILSTNLNMLFQADLIFILKTFGYFFVLPLLCYSILAFPVCWGVYFLLTQKKWLAYFTLSTFIIYQVFVVLYRVGDWPVFLLPSLTILTVPLAFGIAGTLQFLSRQSIKPSIIRLCAVFFLTASALPLWVRFEQTGGIMDQPFSISNYLLANGALTERFDSANDISATVYAEGVWQKVPNGAPIITGLAYETADNELHSLLYQQIVENRNPDSVLIGGGFIHLDWYREQISRKLPFTLSPRQDKIFQSRELWLETMWNEIIDPLLDEGPVYTTSFSLMNPAPKSWMQRARFDYLGQIPIDRTRLAPHYDPYVPSGHVYKISRKTESSGKPS